MPYFLVIPMILRIAIKSMPIIAKDTNMKPMERTDSVVMREVGAVEYPATSSSVPETTFSALIILLSCCPEVNMEKETRGMVKEKTTEASR